MAPRKRRSRRQGCWIEATASGLLRLRFRWRLPSENGLHKFSEITSLRDTPENRASLLKQAAIIGAEIAAERFSYLSWFPNGTKAAYFRPKSQLGNYVAGNDLPTISQYSRDWIARKVPPIVRPSRARDYRITFARTSFLISATSH